jgi:hypothetical protein
MYKKIAAGLIIAFAACYSCQLPENKLAKLWFYTYNNTAEKGDSLLSPASFIDLLQDGRYTMDLGRFDFGRWEYNGSQLLLSSHTGLVRRLTVHAVTGKDLQIIISKPGSLYFEGTPNSFSSDAVNPFSLVNNRWRIPPAGRETSEAITSRLKNHFMFWEMYFTWALNNGIQYIDVRSTPTPVKIYGNGFALKSYETLSSGWKACFYDELDCIKANEKIKMVFDSGSIGWPHTDNKYKMFISAFQQLRSQVK